MLPRLILALAVAVGVWLFISWLQRLPPAARSKLLRQILMFGGIAVLVAAVLTGRLHWLFALLAAMIPLAQRLLTLSGLFKSLKSAMGPTPGQTSDVATRFIRMELNHDTGEMTGEVLQGKFRGSSLGDLSMEELVELLKECTAADAQSAAVLESYLDRVHGDRWRQESAGGPRASAEEAMTAEEAYEVLGLESGASREQIIEAHRKLMQKLHPDRGGPTYLAAKINQAKDFLLGD